MARLKVFISVGPDLEHEREAVARMIANLPVSLGWVLKFTPLPGEELAPALEVVGSCHFYAFVLGQDIRAPMGVEWDLAWRSGRRVFAYRKEIFSTPAARAFGMAAGVGWQEFHTPGGLARLLEKELARELMDRAERYGVKPEEWLKLKALLKEQDEVELEEPSGRGAGGGGVIVSPEKEGSLGTSRGGG